MKITRATARSRKYIVQDAKPRFYFDGDDFTVSGVSGSEHFHVSLTTRELKDLLMHMPAMTMIDRLGGPEKAGAFVADVVTVLGLNHEVRS